MKKLLSVLFVALFAAASVQAVAAESQKVDKKEMKVHKRAKTHVKRTAHKKAMHRKVAYRKAVHRKAVHRKAAHQPEQK